MLELRSRVSSAARCVVTTLFLPAGTGSSPSGLTTCGFMRRRQDSRSCWPARSCFCLSPSATTRPRLVASEFAPVALASRPLTFFRIRRYRPGCGYARSERSFVALFCGRPSERGHRSFLDLHGASGELACVTARAVQPASCVQPGWFAQGLVNGQDAWRGRTTRGLYFIRWLTQLDQTVRGTISLSTE